MFTQMQKCKCSPDSFCYIMWTIYSGKTKTACLFKRHMLEMKWDDQDKA